MPLPCQTIFHRTVIDRFQNAHIERYGIWRVPSAPQISLVFRYQVGVKLVKQDLIVIHKTVETSQCRCIGFRCAYLSQAFQSCYLLADVGIERLLLPVVLKAHNYIIRHKRTRLGQRVYNLVQPVLIPSDT